MTDEIAEDEPFAPFARWFELAAKSEPLAETMTLATATSDGSPSLRAVLLKGADERGFVFYTNLESRKAGELVANPRAALAFHWKSLARRLGLRPVPAARESRRARTAISEVQPAICRAARRTAAGNMVRVPDQPAAHRVLAGAAVSVA